MGKKQTREIGGEKVALCCSLDSQQGFGWHSRHLDLIKTRWSDPLRWVVSFYTNPEPLILEKLLKDLKISLEGFFERLGINSGGGVIHGSNNDITVGRFCLVGLAVRFAYRFQFKSEV